MLHDGLVDIGKTYVDNKFNFLAKEINKCT